MRQRASAGIMELNCLLCPADKALQAFEKHLSRILNSGSPDAGHQPKKHNSLFQAARTSAKGYQNDATVSP